jgi:hypothetical protein
MGLGDEKTFCNYHRVLNRAKWSSLQAARILFGLLVGFVARTAGVPLVIVVDETIERRKGSKVKAKGKYRDTVRSTHDEVVKCFGLKWICFSVLVPMPWSWRGWALPFLTVLAPSQRANKAAGKEHKTTIDWTLQAIKVISRWLPNNTPWTVVGDGAYAAVELAQRCTEHGVTLISRLRSDARLFGFPEPQPKGKRGRKPKKGKRLPALGELAMDSAQAWRLVEIAWYGGETKLKKVLTGVCLWHKNGYDPVKIRWVLVIDPEGKGKPEAFFSTDGDLAAERIVEIFVWRWSIEVTFEEVRRHLGVETQRQWSDLAIVRTTPALMGLFSMVCLMAVDLINEGTLPLRHTAWYTKQKGTIYIASQH